MTRRSGRTETCAREGARIRLTQARKFHEVGVLVASESMEESASVAAALAVFAGLAAADAACCAALGKRSRSQDHRDAVQLVETILPGGSQAAQALGRLLNLKDSATYGIIFVNKTKLDGALRQAEALLQFAERAMA